MYGSPAIVFRPLKNCIGRHSLGRKRSSGRLSRAQLWRRHSSHWFKVQAEANFMWPWRRASTVWNTCFVGGCADSSIVPVSPTAYLRGTATHTATRGSVIAGVKIRLASSLCATKQHVTVKCYCSASENSFIA